MNRLCRLVLGLGLATAVVAGSSGCGESREARKAEGPPAPKVEKRVARAPDVDPLADRAVGPGLTALAPIRDGALVVVPIAADNPVRSKTYLTLDEGMRRGLVSVRELPETDYGQLRVANKSDSTLCVMAGEVVLDGHQDRTFAESLAYAPGAREDVTVRCVEPDRDDGPTRAFRSANAMVHAELRREVLEGSQSTVWEEVRAYNRKRSIHNSTSTYKQAAALQRKGELGAWRERVLVQLRAVPERDRVVGVALALEGRLISVDTFATPELYQQVEPKLLGSFVAQAVDAGKEMRTPRPAEIKDLLAGARGSECGKTAFTTPPEDQPASN
ncbi:MAG: hypothetical protein K8M05_10180 [Deltaproteobacteria bacterium]|nr:hypothetical protein [Kofleriaceae bacterium]